MSGKGLLLKADPIAAPFVDEVRDAIAKSSRRPRLVGILATSSAPSQFYAEFTKKQCDELGVEFILRKTDAADTGEPNGEGVEQAIIEANEDQSIDGIMVRIGFIPSHLSICLLWIRCIIRSLAGSRYAVMVNCMKLFSSVVYISGSLFTTGDC
jgi:hypothetical protein